MATATRIVTIHNLHIDVAGSECTVTYPDGRFDRFAVTGIAQHGSHGIRLLCADRPDAIVRDVMRITHHRIMGS
jgi:hypothetical protein